MCGDQSAIRELRLLLEWGAEISNAPILGFFSATPKEKLCQMAMMKGNSSFASLVQSELGGRRCELLNLSIRPDLNGTTCVVEKWLPHKGRYKIKVEGSGEAALVGPHNLRRRDRTPNDCGYYITYESGTFVRRDFASKEECQAFVASLNGVNESDARAEELTGQLAEMRVDDSKAEDGNEQQNV